MASELPSSTMGSLIPLVAIAIVGLALVAMLGAIPTLRESFRERTNDLREFVGAPPATVAEDAESASESAAQSAAQIPWGNLNLDIYDESRTD